MIKVFESLGNYKSILCLDGILLCGIIKRIGLPVIAADGAANTLVRNGIKPDVIIGDLDSVEDNILCYTGYVKVPNQNKTDFEKALDFIEKKSMDPAIVTGIDGGYMDHVFGNITIFSRTNFVAFSNNVIFLAVEDEKIFTFPKNTKISIFGMPECVVRSEGLKWELKEAKLSISGKNSCSNRSVCEHVRISVLSGKALVFIGTDVVL